MTEYLNQSDLQQRQIKMGRKLQLVKKGGKEDAVTHYRQEQGVFAILWVAWWFCFDSLYHAVRAILSGVP